MSRNRNTATHLLIYFQPQVVTPDTIATPESAYGMGKLVSELFINEYTRRGFIDGRIMRLPTITVRPGAPSAATSSFISGALTFHPSFHLAGGIWKITIEPAHRNSSRTTQRPTIHLPHWQLPHRPRTRPLLLARKPQNHYQKYHTRQTRSRTLIPPTHPCRLSPRVHSQHSR